MIYYSLFNWLYIASNSWTNSV